MLERHGGISFTEPRSVIRRSRIELIHQRMALDAHLGAGKSRSGSPARARSESYTALERAASTIPLRAIRDPIGVDTLAQRGLVPLPLLRHGVVRGGPL